MGLREGSGLSLSDPASLRLRQLTTRAMPATAAAAAKGTPITRAHCHLESFALHPASSDRGSGTRNCVKGRGTLMLPGYEVRPHTCVSNDPPPQAQLRLALRMRTRYACEVGQRSYASSRDVSVIVARPEDGAWPATSHSRQLLRQCSKTKPRPTVGGEKRCCVVFFIKLS